ncbi:prepilin peptidase [Microbacterium thalli]|uniref:prepilin peptidase n=1 Tax=Microbacterium thalli TaxID=3027921 RepID=UPI00236636E7|nr:A24 family peptidase [Microbacterium thalli]MDD7930252.1 A24 family peptidase [Microbacterium thalli]
MFGFAAVLLGSMAALGIALTVVDLREHRLPNRLVLPLYPLGLGYAAALALGRSSLAPVLGAAASAAVLFGAFYLLYRGGGGLGGGDVKLAGAVGVVSGAHGWEAAIAASVVAVLAGGLCALVLIAVRRAGRRTRIPIGPFLVAGATVAIGWGLLGG